MCVLCFGVVVLWCAVLCCYVWVLVPVLVRGVCCVRCDVCGAAWRAEKNHVCRFKTSPCVGSKRFRVYRQNARMCSTCARFAGTHGGVFERSHGEEGRRVGRGVLSSLFLSSVVLFLSSVFL